MIISSLIAKQFHSLSAKNVRKKKKVKMRQPGIEPGSTAWKAAMLTTIPLTLVEEVGGVLKI